MCESRIYLIEGSAKTTVMEEASVVLAEGSAIICINAIGERRTVHDAEIVGANLPRHEITLRKRQG